MSTISPAETRRPRVFREWRTRRNTSFPACTGVTADQTAAVFAQLGGDGDADTQQNITQYFSTVPAQDVDVALRVYAGCMQKVDNDQAQWDQERGAIEQEVSAISRIQPTNF